MESLKVDVAVVGAGINGSWAALHLATMTKSSVLIEQFEMGHYGGSSHGESRIIRRAYPEPFYMAMMEDSYEQWEQIERQTNTKLLTKTGMVTLGPMKEPYVRDIMELVQSQKSQKHFVLMDSLEGNSKLGDFIDIKGDWKVCLEKEGGVLNADLCLKTIQQEAKRRGCRLIDENQVIDLKFDNDNQVTLECKRKDGQKVSVLAKAIVICPGPWASKLLSSKLGLNLPLRPVLVAVYFFKSTAPLPHCLIIRDDDVNVYILPSILDDGSHGIKIGIHGGPDCDPDNREGVDGGFNRGMAVMVIGRYFKQAVPVVVKEELCMYTKTPDEVHIMDWHPKYRNVVIGCGCSGTGFKMAPTNGKIMAEMAVGKQIDFDIKPFSMNRFD